MEILLLCRKLFVQHTSLQAVAFAQICTAGCQAGRMVKYGLGSGLLRVLALGFRPEPCWKCIFIHQDPAWHTGSEIPGSSKNRLELYWPKKGRLEKDSCRPGALCWRSGSAGSKDPVPEHVDEDDTLPDADEELTERDVERLLVSTFC